MGCHVPQSDVASSGIRCSTTEKVERVPSDRSFKYNRGQIAQVNLAMNYRIQSLHCFVLFLLTMAVWAITAPQLLAAEPPKANPAEGGFTDYMLSYLVVVMSVVLGLLVVAKASSRRDRERPAGYVEKNLGTEK